MEVRELSLERNHGITIVMNSNTVQSGDGSWDLVSTQETEDTELSQTSVVKFGSQATLLGFGGLVFAEAKGIIKVYREVDDR